MHTDSNNINDLIYKHLRDEALSQEEQASLDHWLEQSAANRQLLSELTNEHEWNAYWQIRTDEARTNSAFNRFRESVFIPPQEEQGSATEPRIRSIGSWKWVATAAAVLIMISVGAYLWINTGKQMDTDLPMAAKQVAPGKNGAILTLADGSTIVLDSLNNGIIASQQGAKVHLENSKLVYDPAGKTSGDISYNIMTTPRGRQFQVSLPDGTKVWLNAGSSLRYPTAFEGNDRTVEIAGEAFFEVAKNKQKPFIVKTHADRITVTGTQFNVNAYANEPFMKTTLVEGSVMINNAVLKPGQAYMNGQILKTDADQDIAWKNGFFNFTNQDLPAVMRQLERWYDIDVKFVGAAKPFSFNGKMDRGMQLSDVLFFLDEMKITYKLEGRTLTISNE